MKKKFLLMAGLFFILFPLLEAKAQETQIRRIRTATEQCGSSRFQLTCDVWEHDTHQGDGASGEFTALSVVGTERADWIEIECDGRFRRNVNCFLDAVVVNMDHFCPEATKVFISGNGGNDTIDATGTCPGASSSFVASSAEINGGPGADKIKGSDGNDLVRGGLGDDQIFGMKGFDELLGQEGNDRINGGLDGDQIDGGPGNDHLFSGTFGGSIEPCREPLRAPIYFDDAGYLWAEHIEGGLGNDCIDARGKVLSHLQGDAGNDHIKGAGTILGGDGDDVINALITTGSAACGTGYESANDNRSSHIAEYYGEDGNDKIKGSPHFFDFLDGGDGDDYFYDAGGGNIIEGGGGLNRAYLNPGWRNNELNNGEECAGRNCEESFYKARDCLAPRW